MTSLRPNFAADAVTHPSTAATTLIRTATSNTPTAQDAGLQHQRLARCEECLHNRGCEHRAQENDGVVPVTGPRHPAEYAVEDRAPHDRSRPLQGPRLARLQLDDPFNRRRARGGVHATPGAAPIRAGGASLPLATPAAAPSCLRRQV